MRHPHRDELMSKLGYPEHVNMYAVGVMVMLGYPEHVNMQYKSMHGSMR